MIFQNPDDLSHFGGLLTNRNIDAKKIAVFLGNHSIDGDGRLASEAVPNYQFSLSSSDGDHGINCLYPCVN